MRSPWEAHSPVWHGRFPSLVTLGQLALSDRTPGQEAEKQAAGGEGGGRQSADRGSLENYGEKESRMLVTERLGAVKY